MFKRRTLLVVGAGASKEVGLPVGSELAKILINQLSIIYDRGNFTGSGNVDLFHQLWREIKTTSPIPYEVLGDYLNAAMRIKQGILLSNSIDDFIDIHSNNERIKRLGKAAIVASVLAAERDSDLFVDPSNEYNSLNFAKVSETWYVRLMRTLSRNCQVDQLPTLFDNVTIVTFNYDRCIEHFLTHSVSHQYGLERAQASELVAKINIIHPYGTIGSLTNLPFGGHQHSAPDYFRAADRIKTYTEQVASGVDIETISEAMREAEQVLFLGFAYHDQNMKLLSPVDQMPGKYYFGTAYDMSNSDVGEVERELRNMEIEEEFKIEKDSEIHINNTIKCADLFKFYGKSIASGEPLTRMAGLDPDTFSSQL